MLSAIKKEIALRSTSFTQQIETIYFGGGTPSVLTPSEIAELIEQVQSHFDVSENPEITLEANPDDLSQSMLQSLSSSSVNRLSIGIQSFDNRELKMMNRAHNADQALQCLDAAFPLFKNISIDLIYGMPDSSFGILAKKYSTGIGV